MNGVYSLRVKENTLSQCGLAGINMSTDSNISQFINIHFHCYFLKLSSNIIWVAYLYPKYISLIAGNCG